jgi:competence protein ComEA
VFQVKENTRVVTVIELAGGFTESADILSVNMSALLHDEDVIIVEAIEDKSHNLININTATLADLMSLPRLGESKAQAIIDYRDEHGSFKTIEDIMNVPGIGEGTFELFKELISTR